MVRVLRQVLRVLRAKDAERRSHGLPARYWVLEDIDEFVQEFRALAGELEEVPWSTYDFTTMYEALDRGRLVKGVMKAAAEAWKEEQRRLAMVAGKRL